jgi:hypothetical protein
MPRPSTVIAALCTLGILRAAPVNAADPPPPKPMMIAEARLPEGFPPPGPVGEVIVKTYPEHRLARAQGGRDGSFMTLFRHIKRNEIAMTSPVEMPLLDGADRGDGGMAFLYASKSLGTPGPDPADAAVVVEDIPETTVASVGTRGSYSRQTFDRGLGRVRAWLAEHPDWEEAGSPRTLAYNSPFVPGMLKYSEVQVPIRPRPTEPAGSPPSPETGPEKTP